MLNLIAALLCATIAGSALAEPPSPRNGSLIDALQILCNRQRHDFHRLEGVAAAMQMSLASDMTKALPGDAAIHVKEWKGRLGNGAFNLPADEITTADGKASGRAMGGSVPDPDAFRADVMRLMTLPSDPPTLGSGGGRVFSWGGANAVVVVTDFTLLASLA